MIGGLPGLFVFLMLGILVALFEEEGEIIMAILGLIFFGAILFALMWVGV